MLLLMPVLANADRLEFELESGPGRAGGLSWAALNLEYLGEASERRLTISVIGLEAPDGIELGTLNIECEPAAVVPIEHCPRARLEWRHEPLAMALQAELNWQQHDGIWSIEIGAEGWHLSGRIPQADPLLAVLELQFSGYELAGLPPPLLERLGLSILVGRLDGSAGFEKGRMTAALELSGFGFDSADGSLAGDALTLGLQLDAEPLAPDRPFSMALVQAAGEALFGSLYLPAPDVPLRLNMTGRRPKSELLLLEEVRLEDSDALAFEGQAELTLDEMGWQPARIELDRIELDFPLAWSRWLEGLLAGAGFSGIESRGRIVASLDWNPDDAFQLDAELDQIALHDPAGRLGIDGLSGRLAWTEQGPATTLDWQALALYGLTFGPANVVLAGGADGARLLQPLRLPLLDGAVVVERLRWRPLDTDAAGIELDARIEPLSLSELTDQLGWPIFGGQLSGEFPGVRFTGDLLQFTGGIDVQAFSGQIKLDSLAIERPFGTLPALTAEIEFSRLDLLELTGAFNFGRMEGQMSGWARQLRLLDWRPVAMDARVFTHEDVRRRRISQRAVDNLSQLGGAGGALISGTVLRVFDDFPYRRAGLACRLSNNICHIDGVARHESGGFYIVEGRSLPRLDIIGHRRLVDWPQLMGQIAAMMEAES